MSDSAGAGASGTTTGTPSTGPFVRDHREVFERNARSGFVTSSYDRMDAATKAAHTRRAARILG